MRLNQLTSQYRVLAGPPVCPGRRNELGIAYYKPAAGSEQCECDACGESLWLAPEQLQINGVVVCFSCLEAPHPAVIEALGIPGAEYWSTSGQHLGKEPQS